MSGAARDLAAHLDPALEPGDVWGRVVSVNTDGTVNVDVRGTLAPTLPAFTGYTDRARGDQVLVRIRAGEMVVLGKAGQQYTPPVPPEQIEVTVSNSAPPGGAGWLTVATTYVTVDGKNVYFQLVTAPPPPPTPTVGTVVATAYLVDTYRNGAPRLVGKAEQGDYSGLGLEMGVWCFPAGSFAALAGNNIVAVRVSVTRRAAGHGFTYGPVPMTLWTHAWSYLPNVTPLLFHPSGTGGLTLGERGTYTAPTAWGEDFKSGAANGVGCFTDDRYQNVEAELDLTVEVDWST